MGRDCARVERRFPTRLVGTITVGLLFIGIAWVTYAFETRIEMPLPISQASAAEAVSEPFVNLSLDAKAAYVVDLENRVRYTLNPEAQLPLASLTKIALVLAVADVLSPEISITLQNDVSGNGKGDTLPAGSTWRAQDLIDFTLVASSNDGADALAHAADEALRAKYPAAPQGAAALWRMNDLAKEIGLTNTYFTNVTGLDESVTQAGAYGSAHDVAALMLYAAEHHPELFSATKQETVTITSADGLTAIAKNTDAALSAVNGLVMGKTGLTDLAGGNLAVMFDARGRRYIAVVLGSSEKGRFNDVAKIAGILSRTK